MCVLSVPAVMNGPPPKVPGLEPGSKLERAHLTEGNVSIDRIDNFFVGKMGRLTDAAKRALIKGAKRTDIYHPHDKKVEETTETAETTADKMDDTEPRIYDKKTMKDQYGQYPVWMSRKKVQKQARAHRIEKRKARRAERRRSGRIIKVTDVEMKHNSDIEENEESDDSDIKSLVERPDLV